MNVALDSFVSLHSGYPLEVEDSANRDQCMDEAFAWCDALGIPRETIRHLYAYEVFTQASEVTWQYFNVIPYVPGFVVLPGDLVVWKANGVFTKIAGHIDLALEGTTPTQLRALDQNWGGHLYCEILMHPYTDVIGVLRPKNNQGDIAMPASTDLADQTTVQLGYQGILLRTPNADEITMRAGKQTEEQLLRDLNTSPEHGQVVADHDYGVLARAQGWQTKAASVADITEQYQKLLKTTTSVPVTTQSNPEKPGLTSVLGSDWGKAALQIGGALLAYALDNASQLGIPAGLAAVIGLAIGHTVSNVAATKANK